MLVQRAIRDVFLIDKLDLGAFPISLGYAHAPICKFDAAFEV